ILLHEHLLGKVIQDEAMAAGEGGEKPSDISSAVQREGGEVESGHPALCPVLEATMSSGGRSSPITVCINALTSCASNRNSAARSSVSCPWARSRARGSGGSARVARMMCIWGGRYSTRYASAR